MKKRKLLTMVVGLLLIGCGCKKEEASESEKFFRGDHCLRRIFPKVEKIKSMEGSGGFFLFMGGASVESKEFEFSSICFYWQGNGGEYIYTKLPIGKVRFKIDNNTVVPYVKFKWRGSLSFNESILENYIIYGEVVCRDDDFPKRLKFPLED